MIKGFLNLPYFVWTAIALVIAVIFVYVWPRKAVTASAGFRYFVIRWGHALTWVLLAVSFLLRGINSSFNGIANLVAAAGGLTYLLFMVMTFAVRERV